MTDIVHHVRASSTKPLVNNSMPNFKKMNATTVHNIANMLKH